MIGYLAGRARAGGIVLDSSGVGWKVTTAQPLTPGETVELYVTTIVREDAITLYGFADEACQDTFTALTRVTGIGPSLAMAVLAAMTPPDLAAAVASRDVAALARVRGVGPKAAERIITLIALPAHVAALPTSPVSRPSGRDDVVDALLALGWSDASARRAVAAARERFTADPDVLRAALRA